MRKVYLLIINVSTPHGEREFQRKDDWHPKTKKKSGLVFFFFLCHGGSTASKRRTPSLFPFPLAETMTFDIEPLFSLVGRCVVVFQKNKVFLCVRFPYWQTTPQSPLKLGESLRHMTTKNKKVSHLFCSCHMGGDGGGIWSMALN